MSNRKTNFETPVANMSGKVSKDSRTIHRTRNGKTHSYTIDHPYQGPLAESRIRAINLFQQAVNQYTQDEKNPERLAYWEEEFQAYKRRTRNKSRNGSTKFYETRRGFAIATIHAQLKAQAANE